MIERETALTLAALMSDSAFLRILFPLLAFVGPAALVYLGVRGLARRQALLLGPWHGNTHLRLTGIIALLAGLGYIATAGMLTFLLGPIALAMLGLW
jgi:hypothetical protein